MEYEGDDCIHVIKRKKKPLKCTWSFSEIKLYSFHGKGSSNPGQVPTPN